MRTFFKLLIRAYCKWRGDGQGDCKAFRNCAECIGDIKQDHISQLGKMVKEAEMTPSTKIEFNILMQFLFGFGYDRMGGISICLGIFSIVIRPRAEKWFSYYNEFTK